MSKWIAVTKIGKYPQGEITSEMLQVMVSNYDKNFIAAPFISQHRKFDENGELINNERALGWVESYSTDGTFLYALTSEKNDLAWYFDGVSYKYASIEIEIVEINGNKQPYAAAIAITNFPAANIPAIEYNREKIGSRLISAYNKIEIKENKTELVMNEQQLATLCQIFNLPENSSAETVIAKLTEMKNKFAENDSVKSYTDQLEKVISALSEDKSGGDASNIKPGSVEDQISKLTSTVNDLVTQLSKTSQGNLEQAIDQEIQNGKFVAAQKPELLKKYANDIDGFKAFAAASPKIQLNGSIIIPKTESGQPLTYNDLLKDPIKFQQIQKENPVLFEQLRSEWQINPNEKKV